MTRLAPARRALALLRVGSSRFAAYYWSMWCAGATMSAPHARPLVAWSVAAFGFWLLWCLAVELLNRVADQAEDRVNRAERTALCDALGFRSVARWAVNCWIGVAAMSVTALVLAPGWPLAVFLAINAVIGVGYSVGPRLKRHPVLSQIVLVSPLCMPLLTGSAVRGTWADVGDALALAAVLAAFVIGLAGIKDITDTAGDRAVGFASLWVRFIEAPGSGIRLSAIVLAPLAVVTMLVSFGGLPPRMLWLAVAVPVSVAVVLGAVRARSRVEREAAREVMYNYQLLFACGAVTLHAGSAWVLVAALLGMAWWVSASRFLHWNRGVTGNVIAMWWRLLAPTPVATSPSMGDDR